MMEIRKAALAEILPLREAVIILGTDRESPYFAGDFDDTSLHVGAFDSGACIGCATFVKSECDDKPAWQLRGMATEPSRQRSGVGRALLAAAIPMLAKARPVSVVWCNARVQAVPFYEMMGWSVVSDVYVIDGVGPHRKMTYKLPCVPMV